MPLNEDGLLHVKRMLVAVIAVADTLMGEEAAVNTRRSTVLARLIKQIESSM